MTVPVLALAATIVGLSLFNTADARPYESTQTISSEANTSSLANCFPAIGFMMPSSVPESTTNWWCSSDTEYAFVGFSYEVTACQSIGTLKKEFLDIRQRFSGRYVRLYGACDREGFYNDIIDAAWDAGVGVHSLIWFGFDGDDEWKTRRDTLFGILHSNPKGKFVTRAVQFGSEPLYDGVLSTADLTTQVNEAKSNLSSLQIPVTISEMAYGYQERGGSADVLMAIDFIDAHMLPFFSTQATTGNKAWPILMTDLTWFVDNADGKKIYWSQNGWPSTTYPGVEPNSPSAVADVENEKLYYKLLDNNCAYLKTVAGGGVGWFAHIYSDNQEPGYGIYSTDGNLKFPFAPKTSC